MKRLEPWKQSAIVLSCAQLVLSLSCAQRMAAVVAPYRDYRENWFSKHRKVWRNLFILYFVFVKKQRTIERKKKRAKISGLESCYANRIYVLIGVELRPYGQKLVKFCKHTHTHTRVSFSSIDSLKWFGWKIIKTIFTPPPLLLQHHYVLRGGGAGRNSGEYFF